MEFSCKTTADQRALAAMSRAMRKTVQRRSSCLGRGCCWLIIGACLLCAMAQRDWWDRAVVLAAAAVLLGGWICEDRISAAFARPRMLPGMEESTAVFYPACYVVQVTGAATRWQYDGILLLAETRRYFVFILGEHHAQVYDKAGLTGGTAEEFRAFLEGRTGKKTQCVER